MKGSKAGAGSEDVRFFRAELDDRGEEPLSSRSTGQREEIAS